MYRLYINSSVNSGNDRTGSEMHLKCIPNEKMPTTLKFTYHQIDFESEKGPN